jgi:hypothetical protein
MEVSVSSLDDFMDGELAGKSPNYYTDGEAKLSLRNLIQTLSR